MDFLMKLAQLDRGYLESFTQIEDRQWGTLYYNESQPAYYDANHAELISVPEFPEEVVKEVLDFYNGKQIVPRFYMYQPEHQEEMKKALQQAGFRMEELESPVQLWDQQVLDQDIPEDIQIEKVTEENLEEAIKIQITINELGGSIREQALKEEFAHPGYTHYLLKYKGVPCSTASMFHSGDQARLESVATIESYRGKGLVGILIRFIQQETVKQGFQNLWVFPIDEKIEKVYAKYGFDTLESVKMIHAFTSGKSIKEIREGH